MLDFVYGWMDRGGLLVRAELARGVERRPPGELRGDAPSANAARIIGAVVGVAIFRGEESHGEVAGLGPKSGRGSGVPAWYRSEGSGEVGHRSGQREAWAM